MCKLQVELGQGPTDPDPRTRTQHPRSEIRCVRTAEHTLSRAWGREGGRWGLAKVFEEQTNHKNWLCHSQLKTAPNLQERFQTCVLQNRSHEISHRKPKHTSNESSGALSETRVEAGSRACARATSLWFIFLQVARVPLRNLQNSRVLSLSCPPTAQVENA